MLSLRYGDWPIDLDPAFSKHTEIYTATLDFHMGSFFVDARPSIGCDINAPGGMHGARQVDIGGQNELTLYARHPDTGDQKKYKVRVTRLLGSETWLQDLRVAGGKLLPVGFSPNTREYVVELELPNDEVRVYYKLRDNEQRVRSSAKEESPQGSFSLAPPKPAGTGANSHEASAQQDDDEEGKGKDADKERRLQKQAIPTLLHPEAAPAAVAKASRVQFTSGEVQYRLAYESFMIDVGFTRNIELTVQCADPTQANIGVYTLKVNRAGCGKGATEGRDYYDPTKGICVNFCPAGFYRNGDINRCSRCNSHCKVCEGLQTCLQCEPDTPGYSYVITDGRCKPIANHLFKKYQWWCVGLAVLLLFLVCIGCLGICQLCCTGGGSIARGQKARRSVQTYADSDSDDGPPAYAQRRRLGAY